MLKARPCPSCRRSFLSWLCPPRWPRASRSWTLIPAWGEHRQGPSPHPKMPRGGESGLGGGSGEEGHPRGRITRLRVVTALGDSVQISEGGQASEGVWLREDEGELEGAGGDGEEGGPTKCFQMGVRSCGGWAHRCCVHRKALEMSCAIQNQLARILAEFEMALERDVLQPLSRLSEVTLRTPPSPAPPQHPQPTDPTSLPVPTPRRSFQPSSSTRKACRSWYPTGTPSRAGGSQSPWVGCTPRPAHRCGRRTHTQRTWQGPLGTVCAHVYTSSLCEHVCARAHAS